MIADNTAVMPATAKELNLSFFGCFPHAMNLVVQVGITCELFGKPRSAKVLKIFLSSNKRICKGAERTQCPSKQASWRYGCSMELNLRYDKQIY